MGEDPLDVAELLRVTKARGHRTFAGRLERKTPESAAARRARGVPWP
jgi:hypothetical protein